MVSVAALSRGAGLAVLLYLSSRVVARGVTPASSGAVLAILDGTNFVFHEAGHVLFVFFGDFLQALGGSVTQVTIPAMCAAYFLLHHRRAAAAAALFWTGESITHVAIYVADARLMQLPLHGGDDVIHDWNYILGRLNLVDHAEILGRIAFAAGVTTILVALGLIAADLLHTSRRRDGAESIPDYPAG